MYDSYVQENMNYLLWQYMMYERTLSILRARMVFNLHTISYVYVRTTTLEYAYQARLGVGVHTYMNSTYSRVCILYAFNILLASMHSTHIHHVLLRHTTTRVIILLRIRVVVCIHVQVYAYYELVLSMQSIVCICIQCTLVYTRICRTFLFALFIVSSTR